MLIRLAWRSLCNRKASVALTVLALTVSVAILIGVEHIRTQIRDSFSRTISGVDLIVGARTSQINLLLYSVFRIGNATNNISWESYNEISNAGSVAWTIPISLGDSHRGYRVMGTSEDYFEHYRYGDQAPLTFSDGRAFSSIFETVLGYEVANRLGYQVGDDITLSHGIGEVSFSNHDDAPFTVIGILAPTGTPIDQTVHISLQGMEAIHLGWQNGTQIPGMGPDYNDPALAGLEPESITAMMVGLESRIAVFGMQRAINEYQQEALSAILPGVALAQLWQTVGIAEKALSLVSVLVMVATLLGMSTMLLASMRERQREIALYRAIGAHSSTILLLVELESLLITLLGIFFGIVAVQGALVMGRENLVIEYGLILESLPLDSKFLLFMGAIIAAALILAVIPAIAAYRSSLESRLSG